MKIKLLALAISAVLATSTAAWADNTVTVDTTGNNNTLSALQQGGNGNNISISQAAFNNQSTAAQNGNGNSASIAQGTGSRFYTTTDNFGYTGTIANIAQTGGANSSAAQR